MKKTYSEFTRGGITVRYETDDAGRIGYILYPSDMTPAEKDCAVEPLVQTYIRGDNMPTAFANGSSLASSASTFDFHFASQVTEGDNIITILKDELHNREARHTLVFSPAYRAIESYTELENTGDAPFTVELLSSASFGGLTPFDAGEAVDTLELYTATSSWSSEGRLVSETIEDANLETSWSRFGTRVKKIHQRGSMPVRGYFPFMAIRDKIRDVTWAVQVACPSSWQIEARRNDFGLSLDGGLIDYDEGQWAKELKPGESFRTPSMYITVGKGSAEKVAQQILDLHERNRPKLLKLPPVMFNEYCTTWGVPSHENLSKIVKKLEGKGMEYLVIDAGWYKNDKYDWSQTGGDWVVAEKLLFPEGFQATVDMIKKGGMIPGLWFESETCGPKSDMHEREDMLLKRNGAVIDTGSRRFLDLRKPEVKAYMDERIIGLLKKYGFGYIKSDYNDCIGTGCDGAESLGEGLRQNMIGAQDFYRRLREAIPGITMENCSSGGHRLEPSMMGLFDMASFSDAHECVSIPIIAANLHRLILPIQSQIWAVLHGSDSLRRLHYSVVNTYLGAMCLSGDIYSMNDEQWALVDRDIAFYRKVRHIIAHGTSEVKQPGLTGYSKPKGYQTVLRKGESGDALLTVHTFAGELPEYIEIPVGELQIKEAVTSENNEITLENGILRIQLKANFEAIAVWLG